MMINSIEEYLASVHPAGQAWLNEFYGYMKENHRHLKPVMFRQRPMYKIGKSYVMFTAAEHHFSVHTLNFELIEEYRAKIPGSGTAKGCLNIKYTNLSAKPLLMELCDRVIDRNSTENAPQPGQSMEMPYEEQLSKVFSLSKAKWRLLYEKLRDTALKELPDFTEYFPAVGILWKHPTTFAGITCKKDALQIEFYSDSVHEERNPVKIQKLSAKRVAHMVEAADESAFEGLIPWLRESYHLTKKK